MSKNTPPTDKAPTEKLEDGADNSAPSDNSPEPKGTPEDLRAAFEEEKNELNNTPEVGIKKKRGRKPGQRNKPSSGQPSPDGTVSGAAPAAPFIPPPVSPLDGGIAEVVKFPFNKLAKKERWDGWQLSQDEAMSIASPLDQFMQVFFPQLNGPYALLGASVMAAAMVYLGKLAQFNAYEEERVKNAKNITPVGEEKKTPNPLALHAQSY